MYLVYLIVRMILAVIEELKVLCADELAEDYRPRAFYPVDAMLLIPYGQIDFRELERMAEEKCRIITIEKEGEKYYRLCIC